ncbi:MAG TPA: right-handed parallel beta-helix repeat-containing protein [Opitutaceae bacterium]|nr:right-handed parallel beta-helix repeat-containing protein [Opitutaceae bacterium]
MKTSLCLLLGLLAAAPALATNYYVDSSTGSPSNPGTQAAPFQNIDQLFGLTLQPGDNVYFARGGTYGGVTYPNYLEITANGTATQPITFTSYGSGNLPAFINPGEYYVIRLAGDYLVLDGVVIHNTTWSGAEIKGDHDVIQNCEIYDCGWGINIADASNARVTGNHIHNLNMIQNDTASDNDFGAVGINIGTLNGADIGWNDIHDCIAASHDYGLDGGAFEIYGNVSNADIHHNLVHDNNGVFETGGGAASNIKIYYNLCVHNRELGGFHLTGTFVGTLSNFKFENNTVVETVAADNYDDMIWFDGTNTMNQFSMKNNIFYFDGFNAFTNQSGFTHEYNIYYAPNSAPLGFTLTSTELVANPQFVNLSGGNYHLTSTSPAVNAGASLGYTHDRDANSITNTPDIGCFESTY